MKSDFYCNPRVSKKALGKFLSMFQSGRDELHTFEVFHRDDLVVRLAPAPYSCTDKREIYSLSKSFCSTAVGILVTEGKVSVEDCIVDLFPDLCPENPCENLRKMKLRHVLSMNTGHPSCVMGHMIRAESAAKAFLAQPIPYEPGTHFAYNTGATCLCSCLVTRLTGMTVLDFLSWKLFMPLGIEGVRWNRVSSGESEGGCDIHVSADDIAKLGRLYLHKGVWNGKRILSEEWVDMATSPISDNSMNGSPDWCAGYGFQFWCNARGGYRGDGAFGQLCFVLPEQELVFAVQTELGDMQREIDGLMELSAHLFDEDPENTVVLPEYAPVKSAQRTCGYENVYYALDKNPMGWTGAYVTYSAEEDASHLVLSDGVDQFTIRAGAGYWAESSVFARRTKPKLVGLMSTDEKELCRMVSSYEAEDGKLTLSVRYLNCPHKMRFELTFAGDTLHISMGPRDRLEGDSAEIDGKRL